MQKSIAYISIFLLLQLAACTEPDEDKKVWLVEKYYNQGQPCPVECSYDNENHLLTAAICDTIETYTYFQDSVILVVTKAGTIQYQNTYFLNTKGIATGYRQYKNGLLSIVNFAYDADGIRTSIWQANDSGTYKRYTIQNKNIVAELSRSSSDNFGNFDITSSYYKETINTLSNENFGRKFLGNSSQNLKRGETWDTYLQPDPIFVYSFKYETDENSLVHKRVKILNGKDTAEVRYYVYR